MADHVLGLEPLDPDPFHILEDAQGVFQTGIARIEQIDLLNPRDSGLRHALRILEDVKGVGVQRFQAQDVVRHAMVERIVRAYDADAAKHRPAADLEDPDS